MLGVYSFKVCSYPVDVNALLNNRFSHSVIIYDFMRIKFRTSIIMIEYVCCMHIIWKKELMRLVGATTLFSSAIGAWIFAQSARTVTQRYIPWGRWSQLRRRIFARWCLLALISIASSVSGGYTAFTGDGQGVRWSLAFFNPLMWLLFIPQPCSVECIQASRMRRWLRACCFVVLGGVSIFLAVQLKM